MSGQWNERGIRRLYSQERRRKRDEQWKMFRAADENVIEI
jgi:hypothetical protein